MPRYTIRAAKPRQWIEDEDAWDVGAQSHVPDVPDHEATFTGPLDHTGGEIWREPRPIGFGRDDEW